MVECWICVTEDPGFKPPAEAILVNIWKCTWRLFLKQVDILIKGWQEYQHVKSAVKSLIRDELTNRHHKRRMLYLFINFKTPLWHTKISIFQWFLAFLDENAFEFYIESTTISFNDMQDALCHWITGHMLSLLSAVFHVVCMINLRHRNVLYRIPWIILF